MNHNKKTILKLTVNNHPGVLSHICGLFSRRFYNLEALMVRELIDSPKPLSRVWLLIDDNEKTINIIKQLEKLYDVNDVIIENNSESIFDFTENYFLLNDKQSISN